MVDAQAAPNAHHCLDSVNAEPKWTEVDSEQVIDQDDREQVEQGKSSIKTIEPKWTEVDSEQVIDLDGREQVEKRKSSITTIEPKCRGKRVIDQEGQKQVIRESSLQPGKSRSLHWKQRNLQCTSQQPRPQWTSQRETQRPDPSDNYLFFLYEQK